MITQHRPYILAHRALDSVLRIRSPRLRLRLAQPRSRSPGYPYPLASPAAAARPTSRFDPGTP
jgi:hypothetical protein